MKAFLCSLLLVAFALVAFAQAPQAAAPATERKADTGVTISKGPMPKGGPITCTLTLSPNTATNGGKFAFTVGYSPCVTVAQTETFTFPWKSNLATFTEVTVRTKIFKTSSGCVVASADGTVVPNALAIKGQFKATVAVKETATNAPICTASAVMTVN